MRKKSFPNWQEGRRSRGIELYRQGWYQALVAEALGVSRTSVHRWIRAYEDSGNAALESAPRPGAPARLSMAQKFELLELLYPGAEAWGFVGDIWTCGRIARVIKRHFGVSYHHHHVAKIMKEMNWSSHKPNFRASQRDEAEIANWKYHKWPAIKKSRKRGKNSISPR